MLIGLAVAVDYSLFMITRFRTERRHGRSKLAAIDVASATAGRAVFFSGLAVMVSIGGLFLLDDPLFRSMAVGTIAVVLIAVIGSLTFLPATLAILGDGLNRLRLPILGRDREEGSGLWARIVRSVMRHPLPAALLAAAFLLVLASPALRLRLGQADFASFPDSIDSVQALNILNEKWPTGTTLSLDVVVTHADEPATKAAIEALTTKVLADPRRDRPAEDLPVRRRPRRDALVHHVRQPERRGEPRDRARDAAGHRARRSSAACPASRRWSQATPPTPTTSSASTRTGCRW